MNDFILLYILYWYYICKACNTSIHPKLWITNFENLSKSPSPLALFPRFIVQLDKRLIDVFVLSRIETPPAFSPRFQVHAETFYVIFLCIFISQENVQPGVIRIIFSTFSTNRRLVIEFYVEKWPTTTLSSFSSTTTFSERAVSYQGLLKLL